MKYLQTFSLFESRSAEKIFSDSLWDLIVSRAGLSVLLKKDEVAWSCVIDLCAYDEYLESYEDNSDGDDDGPMGKMEYKKWIHAYDYSSENQKSYDDLINCLNGYSDWCDDHSDKPLEWYMEQFGVSRGLGLILKVWNGPAGTGVDNSIELWDAMDEFPEIFQPFLKDKVDSLIANWNSQIANEVRAKAPVLWREVIKIIDPTDAETSADLGELGF